MMSSFADRLRHASTVMQFWEHLGPGALAKDILTGARMAETVVFHTEQSLSR
jgi:hypothetical protein